MPNIYKLKYTDKDTAIADLISKGCYTEDLTYCEGIHAIVEIGVIILNDATYDDSGNELTQPTFIEGYHYDIMCNQEIDFGENQLTVTNPLHTFSGYEE